MKLINIVLFLIVSALMLSCESDNLRGTSFANQTLTPINVAVLVDVAIDNSGIVNLYPSAEGASNFEVDFGDGSDLKVFAAEAPIIHVYETGTFEVKVAALSTSGVRSEEVSESFFILSTCVVDDEENIDGTAGPLNITIFDRLESGFTPLGGFTTRAVYSQVFNLSNMSCNIQEVVRKTGCSSFAGLLRAFTTPFTISETSDNFTIDLYGVENTVDLNILFVGSQTFNMTQSLTAPDEWEKLSFDLSAHHGETLTRVILYFDKGETCEDEVYYFDNIQL